VAGYLIMITTDESARRWTNIKRRMSFCRITQDGDDEEFLPLDMPPTADDAATIRDAIGVRRCGLAWLGLAQTGAQMMATQPPGSPTTTAAGYR
jgi:hypothetical protein